MFQGTYEELVESDTITARELGRVTDINRKPRRPAGFLTIENASLHNLKNVTVHIPKNALTVVSGIAGSGKSSLILGELVKRYPDAAHISQAPIGTSARSTPASYIGVMDEIRKLFAAANHEARGREDDHYVSRARRGEMDQGRGVEDGHQIEGTF